ncbi:redoxin domain-containing protein [Stieleria sp. TO1_6]|uniref:redoxin domain-containing protein n=1 Tax=Stieleria tagensis TaxID=2956795 RepID=UPI00209A99D8|nr:redoxin domain-containing protein [Stieleria tagensis]MCO8124604.1 redoxin domain-containing protein [Stieleria tagensis]
MNITSHRSPQGAIPGQHRSDVTLNRWTRRPWFGAIAVTISLWALSAASVVAAGPEKPLAVDQQAPDFDLPVQGQDDYVSLSDLAKQGPVVVIVLRGYPGYQCVICTRQVGSLLNRANALAAATGNQPRRVVLIYPGPAEKLERHANAFFGSRKMPETFVVVRDPEMKLISEWGLRWDDNRETAYPAAYLIGPGRRVKWAKVSDSHAGRASVDDILKAIKNNL